MATQKPYCPTSEDEVEAFLFALYQGMATPAQQRLAMRKIAEAGFVMAKAIQDPTTRLLCSLAATVAIERCEELARQRTN